MLFDKGEEKKSLVKPFQAPAHADIFIVRYRYTILIYSVVAIRKNNIEIKV